MALLQSRGPVSRLLQRILLHGGASISPSRGEGFWPVISISSEGQTSGYFLCQRIRSIVSCSLATEKNASLQNQTEEILCSSFSKLSSVHNNGLSMRRDSRAMSTGAKVPAQALRQGGMQVAMLSPGFIYEPYKPREPIPFWRRWFTPAGWRRTKEDMIMELKNAYTVARLRKKTGYSRKEFYQEALKLYKEQTDKFGRKERVKNLSTIFGTEINTHVSTGDKASLRKLVTENMFSAFKNDLKRREALWKSVYWELVEPVVRIRTLRARMIGVDRQDIDKAFVQLTLEFLTKQKFEAYDSNGAVVKGDKTKEVLVRDIWVLERSLFHPGSYWRLCGRISL